MKYILSALVAGAACIAGAVFILLWILHSVSVTSSPYAWAAILLKITIGVVLVYAALSIAVVVGGIIAGLYFLERDRF